MVSGNGYVVQNSCLDVNIDVSQVSDLSVSGRAHALRASLVPSQQPWLMVDCDHVVFFPDVRHILSLFLIRIANAVDSVHYTPPMICLWESQLLSQCICRLATATAS